MNPSDKPIPRPPSVDTKARHLEKLLDEALDDTFPASDPVAIDVPHDHPRPDAETNPDKAS